MKFIICGNYGIGNLGDEAILDGIIHSVKSAHPHAKIVVLSSNPDHTKKLHLTDAIEMIPAGFKSFFRGLFSGSFGRTIKEIKNCDRFILGGGGLFTDEKFKACIIWWIQAKTAVWLHKPLYLIGQSVGPLNTKLGRFLTKSVFKKATKLAVRDEKSRELLSSLSVTNVEVVTDAAFAIPLDSPLPFKQEPYLVLSIRPWTKPGQKPLYNICSHFIDWAYKTHDLKTFLVPFQSSQDNDVEVLNNILAHVSNKEAAKIIPYSADYKETLSLIGNATAIIGMRLHSIIFSMLCKKPFIALSYSSKVADFCDLVEMGEYVVSTAKIDTEILEKLFEKLLNNYQELKNHLIGMELVMRKKAGTYAEILK